MPGPSLASLGLEVAVWSPRLGIQRIYRDPGPGFRRGREKATEQPGAALEQARAALHRELVVKPNISSAPNSASSHTVTAVVSWGHSRGGVDTGSPNWLPEKEWGPRLLLSWQSKDFQRSNSHCGKFQARGGGRETAQCSPGGFSQEDSPELGACIQGEQRLMQPSLSSSTAHILHPGKRAFPGCHQTPTKQVNVEFTTPRAHLAYTSAILANDQPKEEAACSCFL